MKLVKDKISIDELGQMANNMFEHVVKAVVDVEQGIMVVDAPMHADQEFFLLENDSEQKNLWGINLYPKKYPHDWIEFDSMINVRPIDNNRSRYVNDHKLRQRIVDIVNKLVTQ